MEPAAVNAMSTVDDLATIQPQSNLWRWYLLVAARSILQEYDAFTVELATHPAESGKLAAGHNLVEIAKACGREVDAFTMDGMNPVSVQPVEMEAAGCCSRIIRHSTKASPAQACPKYDHAEFNPLFVRHDRIGARDVNDN